MAEWLALIGRFYEGYGYPLVLVAAALENTFLVTLFFYIVHEVVYFVVARGMVGLTLEWSWPHELGSALANALLAVALFALLDRFKRRT